MLKVRPEVATDNRSIFALHAASFPSENEAKLVDLLRSAGRLTVSLVAEVKETIVGHIAFSPVSSQCGSIGVGLAPLAVDQSYRRQGIADKLIRAGLAACDAAGFKWAVVLGDPAYYCRFGFRPAAAIGLVDEYGGGSAFQFFALKPDTLPASGTVRYAPEFALFAWE